MKPYTVFSFYAIKKMQSKWEPRENISQDDQGKTCFLAGFLSE